jgi:hypothetical protein
MTHSKPITPSEIPDNDAIERAEVAKKEDFSDRAKIGLTQLREQGHHVIVRKEWVRGDTHTIGPLLFAYYHKEEDVVRECIGPVNTELRS